MKESTWKRKERMCFKVVGIEGDTLGYACSRSKTKRGIYNSMRKGKMKSQTIVYIDHKKKIVHVV